MGIAGAMRNFDPNMGMEEFFYSYKEGKNQSGQGAETEENLRDVFSALIQDQREELEERIRNGTSEPSYQIGANSFTEREWTKLIRSVDAVQEAMREAAERERELQKEAEQAEEAEKAKKCIIVYDIDGIRCIETETGICRWFIKFTDGTQYSKVQEIMQGVEAGAEPAPVLNESFWQTWLN